MSSTSLCSHTAPSLSVRADISRVYLSRKCPLELLPRRELFSAAKSHWMLCLISRAKVSIDKIRIQPYLMGPWHSPSWIASQPLVARPANAFSHPDFMLLCRKSATVNRVSSLSATLTLPQPHYTLHACNHRCCAAQHRAAGGHAAQRPRQAGPPTRSGIPRCNLIA